MCSEAAEGSAGIAPVASIQSVAVSSTAAPLSRHPVPPCRILLVEDHADTAAMMQRLLARRGYVVTVATTVAEACNALRSGAFDLLLSDLGLPDGSGLDVMREAASVSPKLPGIALSGYGMPGDARKTLEAGFLEHLTKPVIVERLWSTLDRVLASSAAPVNS
jgi:two-component system CheB/CheR fusion protein